MGIEVKNTIELKQLYAVFHKIKLAEYGSSVEIRDTFTATTEDIYCCYQKELNAQAQIGKN